MKGFAMAEEHTKTPAKKRAAAAPTDSTNESGREELTPAERERRAKISAIKHIPGGRNNIYVYG